jgi:glycosyltransferase involved in cell wall biosynthesis
MPPKVTIILSTYNRGIHIIPTIRSALMQTMKEFELLVIGDCVNDDTGAQVKSCNDPRLRWINLENRVGTQSGPNNCGLSEARAPIVAYMDHEDIWAPRNLEYILQKYKKFDQLDAVVSGIVLHRDNYEAPYKIEGIFPDFSPFDTKVFAPPTGFSHRIARRPVPRWKTREETDKSVDFVFQQELADFGYQFGSTGEITVHKFLSVEKYLGYLQPSSHEQAQLLKRMQLGSMENELADIVHTAKNTGFYLRDKPHVGQNLPARSKNNDQARGLELPALKELGSGRHILQSNDIRPNNWFPLRKNQPGLRWCGPSRLPRLLVPVSHNGLVQIELDLAYRREQELPDIQMRLNGQLVRHKLSKPLYGKRYSTCRMSLTGRLKSDAHSILDFHVPKGSFVKDTDNRERRFAVGDIWISPNRYVKSAKRNPKHPSHYFKLEPKAKIMSWTWFRQLF